MEAVPHKVEEEEAVGLTLPVYSRPPTSPLLSQLLLERVALLRRTETPMEPLGKIVRLEHTLRPMEEPLVRELREMPAAAAAAGKALV